MFRSALLCFLRGLGNLVFLLRCGVVVMFVGSAFANTKLVVDQGLQIVFICLKPSPPSFSSPLFRPLACLPSVPLCAVRPFPICCGYTVGPWALSFSKSLSRLTISSHSRTSKQNKNVNCAE